MTNATDTVNGNTSTPVTLAAAPGADGISLREAVTACNNATGPHTITFATALNGQTIALTTRLRITRDGIAVIGITGSDGKPGITMSAPPPQGEPIAVEVLASDVTWSRIRLTAIRQVYGLRAYTMPGGPLVLRNLRIVDCEFVSGGAPSNCGISVGFGNGVVNTTVANVTIANSSFHEFLGDSDCILVAAGDGGCLLNSLDNLRIEGNRFENNLNGIEVVPSNGAAKNRVQGLQILRNTFVDNTEAVLITIGISSTPSPTSDNVIVDTLIQDNVMTRQFTGVLLNAGETNAARNQFLNTRIVRNTIIGTADGNGTGISIVNGLGLSSTDLPSVANVIADTVITENTISATSAAVRLTGGAPGASGNEIRGTEISRNTLSDNLGSAVSLTFFGSATLPVDTLNTIRDTSIAQNVMARNRAGIVIYPGPANSTGNQILNTRIASNLFTRTSQASVIGVPNGGSGTVHDNRIDSVLIVNNTIVDNPLSDLAVVAVANTAAANTTTGVKLANNLFWKNPGGDFGGVMLPGDVTYNFLSDPAYVGKNGNIGGEAKFVDSANGDYRLRAGSPAIDAGTSDSAPTTDLEGRPRFDDPATTNTGAGTTKYFDIGAYEFASVSTAGRLINLSILTPLASASDTLTVGTVLGGAGTGGSKPLLVRAAGPSLAPLGVTGALADPRLDLYSGSTVAVSNEDWGGTAALTAAFAQVGAFPFAAASSKDAAVAYTANLAAPPESRTVQVSGNGGAGTVLTEIYDASTAGAFTVTTPRLLNVSVLKNVGSGITAGFVVGGTTTVKVLVRAIGPSLAPAPFNVAGAMADPKLELFDAAGKSLASNNDWQGTAELTAAFAQVGAFTLDANSKDAALVRTLTPGSYTAQVTPASGSTGIALVELYEVP